MKKMIFTSIMGLTLIVPQFVSANKEIQTSNTCSEWHILGFSFWTGSVTVDVFDDDGKFLYTQKRNCTGRVKETILPPQDQVQDVN